MKLNNAFSLNTTMENEMILKSDKKENNIKTFFLQPAMYFW